MACSKFPAKPSLLLLSIIFQILNQDLMRTIVADMQNSKGENVRIW